MCDEHDHPFIPPMGHPAYWDLAYVYAEVHADGLMDGSIEAITGSVQTMGAHYGNPGVADMSAMLLARVRLIDTTTPGKELVVESRAKTSVVRVADGQAVQGTAAPYQVAAYDQIAPVLAEALDLDRCDARSIALFLRAKMETSPIDHLLALVSVADGMLNFLRRKSVFDAHAENEK